MENKSWGEPWAARNRDGQSTEVSSSNLSTGLFPETIRPTYLSADSEGHDCPKFPLNTVFDLPLNRPRTNEIFAVEKEQQSTLDSPMTTRNAEQSSSLKTRLKRLPQAVQDFYHRTSPADKSWRPALIRLGPLLGIFAIFISNASLVTSLGILAGSNHAAVSHWAVPPSTYLAICTAISNVAMRYACIQGVIIAWWYRAYRGSTLSKLHHDWRSGTTLLGAITSGRRMGWLGLACVFSFLVVIDGPILQRATTIVTVPFAQPVQLNVTIAQEIPTGYTGWWARNAGRWTGNFNSSIPTATGTTSNDLYALIDEQLEAKVAPLWFRDEGLPKFVQGCKGNCTAKIRAPALTATMCTSHSVTANYTAPISQKMALSNTMSLDMEHMSFLTTTSLLVGDRERVNLVTGHAQVRDCAAQFKYQACTLESAVGEYDISIQDDVVAIDPVPSIVALANNTVVNNTVQRRVGNHPSTLAGIVQLSFEKWECFFGSWTLAGDKAMTSSSYGYAFEYFLSYNKREGQCLSFEDPYETILRSLNRVMVIYGIIAANEETTLLKSRIDPGLETNVVYTGEQHNAHEVYRTDFSYFFAVMAVQIVCISFILPTYWGWWKLGRAVSFSPLEIAKAFDSQLLAEQHSNSSARDLARSVRDVRIQYGEILDGEQCGQAKLTFAAPDTVSVPKTDSRLQQ